MLIPYRLHSHVKVMRAQEISHQMQVNVREMEENAQESFVRVINAFGQQRTT